VRGARRSAACPAWWEELTVKTNAQLQRDVLDELQWEPGVDAAQIAVTARDGVVTLTGHVSVYAQKFAAEEAVKRVHGVKAVANDLTVRPPDSGQLDDADIAASALHALKWDATVPDDRVRVTVRDGWITLEGAVDRQFQKEAADRAVRRLIGARGVTNTILVKAGETASDIKGSIEAAFRRSAILDSTKIRVEKDDGTVTLSGDVHSHVERDEAERIAWAAPGVSRVVNDITITPWLTARRESGVADRAAAQVL
jgi:osmotically-inducible protein OsmY